MATTTEKFGESRIFNGIMVIILELARVESKCTEMSILKSITAPGEWAYTVLYTMRKIESVKPTLTTGQTLVIKHIALKKSETADHLNGHFKGELRVASSTFGKYRCGGDSVQVLVY